MYYKKFCSTDLWQEIKELSCSSKQKICAVGYVTDDSIIKFNDNDILICDASDNAIASGETTANLIAEAINRNCQVFSLNSLHSKLLIFDNTVVIGSSNISKSSRNNLVEVGVVTNEPQIYSCSRIFIEDLIKISTKVDNNFLSHILKLKVKERTYQSNRISKSKRKKLNSRKISFWITNLKLLKDNSFPDETKFIDKGYEKAEKNKFSSETRISWIRFPGKTKLRRNANRGDLLIEIIKFSKSDIRVYPPRLIIFRQDENNCTRFYVESSNFIENNYLTWEKFQSLLNKIEFPIKITQNTNRELNQFYFNTLCVLWDL